MCWLTLARGQRLLAPQILMDKINQHINELCSAITRESDASKIARLATELNRILADKFGKMGNIQPSSNQTPETA